MNIGWQRDWKATLPECAHTIYMKIKEFSATYPYYVHIAYTVGLPL
jgi:hypothetical protein